jgi:hypothetical protein
VLQGLAARGQPIVSTDASRAYDTVTHVAITEALRGSGVPEGVVRYVATSVSQREYSLARCRIIPPAGRGIAQGTALGPALFSLVAERAAAAAEKVAPWSTVVTYIDNLYITAEEGRNLGDALAAAREQWKQDGMAAGETRTLNTHIEGVRQGGRDARFLGVSPLGDAPERFARARALAQNAGRVGALAELILLREVASAQVVYDLRLAASDEVLQALEDDMVNQVARRAGIDARLKGVVQLPPALRGLGLRPLCAARDAAVLAAGLAALTAREGVLPGAVWGLVEKPAGAFFERLAEVLQTAGYVVDAAQRQITQGGKLVVRAPRNIRRAASLLEATRAAAEADEVRGTERGDFGNSAVAHLLTAPGPKPALEQGEYEAAVWLQCGLTEPEVADVRDGDRCPLCDEAVERGHHRWCQGVAAAPSRQHHAVRDAAAAWMAQADAVHVTTETPARREGGGTIRADLRAAAPKVGRITVEVKTVDLRCKSHSRTTLRAETRRLEAVIAADYGGRAAPMVLSHSGAYESETADTLRQLQAARQHAEPHLDVDTPLLAAIGKACATAERESFDEWAERVAAARAAARLAAARGGSRTGTRRRVGAAAANAGAAGSDETFITPCSHGSVQSPQGGSWRTVGQKKAASSRATRGGATRAQ